MSRQRRPHDASFKALFRSPLMVQHLVRCFCPDPELDHIDFGTLSPVPNELVTKALGKRHIDSVWQVQTHAGQRMYVLIEFQRTPHPHMALRTCFYSGLLYETLLAHEQIPAQSMWPPVLCIVLYHGDRSWHAPTRLHDRIWRPRRGLLKPAMLQHRHLLLDINRDVPHNIQKLNNLVTMLMRFERSLSPAELPQLLHLLDQTLPDDEGLRDQFAQCIGHMVGDSSSIALMTNDTLTWKELNMSLAQRMVQWEKGFYQQGRQEGREEGRQEGREEGVLMGQAGLLQRQLQRRFGDLSPTTLKRLNQATPEQLDRWGMRVLEAQKLSEVFRAEG